MLKKIILIAAVSSIFFLSCGKAAEDQSSVPAGPEETSLITDQNEMLVSPDDMVIDPSVPILDDAQLMAKSRLSSFDRDAVSILFTDAVGEQVSQLKSSLDFSSLTVNYFNAEDFDVDINGWVMKDADTDSLTIDNGGPLVVPAGGYLVLGRSESIAGYSAYFDLVPWRDGVVYKLKS